jgi:WD40 repeat protein
LFSLPGHQRMVVSVAFSPDGRTLATASHDNTAKIWDLTSRRALATLVGHTDAVRSVCFSPSGDLLVTASDTSLRLWDGKTFQSLHLLPEGSFEAKFSPDGKYLVAGGVKRSLIVYDTATWKVMKVLEVPGLRFWGGNEGIASIGLAFSPDSRRISVVLDDGVKLLGIPDLQDVGMLKDAKGGMPRPRFVSFSRDNRTLVACTTDESYVKLWDSETQKEVKSISAHSDSVYGAAFSPDGKMLATCSPDQTVKLWDVASGGLLRTFKGHRGEVCNVAFSPDGKLLASVSNDGAIKLWDASVNLSQSTEFQGPPFGFTSDGNLMAFNKNGTLLAFDLETIQKLSAQNVHDPLNKVDSFWVFFGNLFSDGRTACVAIGPSPEYRLDVFDLNRRQFLCSVESSDPLAAFAPKRQLLAAVTSNRTVTVWQLPAGSRKFVITNATRPLAFSPDGTMLATAHGRGAELKLWKLEGDLLRQLAAFDAHTASVDTMAFAPDGAMLATAVDEGFVKLWNVPSGQKIGTLTGHKRSNFGISFSPDGRTLASMADDRTVRLWHLATQRELMRFQLPMDNYAGDAVGFSPDGRALLASRGMGMLNRVYYAPSFAEIALAEGKDYRSEMRKDPASWLVIGKALAKRNRDDEALEAFTEVIQRCANQPQLETLQISALSHRTQVFKRLGRFAEAAADNLAALDLPKRNPKTPAHLIDLSAYFNGSLDSEPMGRSIPARPFLDNLPRGFQILPGSNRIQFDLRGVVQLNHADEFPGVPRSVEGIQIGQKCHRLYFLQATGWRESEDAAIGAYILHYADGTQQEVPILYGQDLLEWISPDSDALRIATVAWTGTNSERGAIRLFERTWQNPHPDVEIETLDFVSKMTKCAPFLIAITAAP